jgi:hypothetical protein
VVAAFIIVVAWPLCAAWSLSQWFERVANKPPPTKPSQMQITFDTSSVADVARQLDVMADQIPFAMSKALNKAVFAAREVLTTQTWPHHVTQRRANFPSAVLRVDVSDKHNLTVAIREQDSAAPSLTLHAEGGTKIPHKAKRFAIPSKGWVVRTGTGVRSDQTPRAVIQRTPKRALRITDKGIFVGEGGRLHLRFSFKSTAQQSKDVPFFKDFEDTMRAKVAELLPEFLLQAQRTRRA